VGLYTQQFYASIPIFFSLLIADLLFYISLHFSFVKSIFQHTIHQEILATVLIWQFADSEVNRQIKRSPIVSNLP